jgi:2,3,4,5-tetrahydropyridine-2-carboxylate N-succinyltransferase
VTTDLASAIDELWEGRDGLSPDDTEAKATVDQAIDLLDSGAARVAELGADGEVVVHEWLKKAILLLFRLSRMETIEVGPFEYHDKLPLKGDFEAGGVRAVPGASVRRGAYLEPGVVLMPSYVNIGARVGAGTMVDTWATVASCAQIGRNVHLAGVLEPPQASPVMVGDNAMIGSRCMITQGARVGEGAVLGEGVILNPGIPVIDAATGDEVGRGVVPPYAIGVQAGRMKSFPGGEFTLPCVLILRYYEPGERTHINEILRESGVNVG